jgi:hypothetical protein
LVSGFLRPQARAVLIRWREAIAAGAVIALGLWISQRHGVILPAFGWVLMAGGALALVPSVRRARFASSGQGPGVVSVTEGQISYLGPYYGGAVAMDLLEALSLRRADDGQTYWVLTQASEVLVIPSDALGAEALFDAFAALDGLRSPQLLSAMQGGVPGTTVLWRRAPLHPALTR